MSESNTLERLIHRFLEDREGLSDAEFPILLEALRTQPHLVERLKDHLIMDELLAQQYAMDRKDFVGKFEQRLREETKTATPAAAAVPDQSHETYALRWPDSPATNGDGPRTSANSSQTAKGSAEPPRGSKTAGTSIDVPHQEGSTPGSSRWNFVWVLLGLLALAGGLLGLEFSAAARKIAVVKAVTGIAIIHRNDVSLVAKRGMAILPGDDVEVQEDGELNITYRDGSRVKVAADSRVQFQPDAERWPGFMTMDLSKEIHLSAGRLEGLIQPQAPNRVMVIRTPQVETSILGTRLIVECAAGKSRVEVIEGRVTIRSEQQSVSAVELTSGHQLVASSEEFRVAPGEWPVQSRDLVFLLPPTATVSRTPNEGVQLFAAGPDGRPVVLRPRRDASFESGRMQFRSGAFLAEDQIAAELLAHCQETNELTVEVTFQTPNLEQAGPARWITFSTDSDAWNFSLAQEGRQCVLRLLTSTDSGEQQNEVPLFELPDDQPHHIAITYSPGDLRCYLDGHPLTLDSHVQGTFAAWSSHRFLFGDEWTGEREWTGSLTGVAIYNRAMPADEIARNRLHFQLRYEAQDTDNRAEE